MDRRLGRSLRAYSCRDLRRRGEAGDDAVESARDVATKLAHRRPAGSWKLRSTPACVVQARETMFGDDPERGLASTGGKSSASSTFRRYFWLRRIGSRSEAICEI
jgi:hypothetical protein